MDLPQYIPKHKGDHEAIERLKGKTIAEIRPILPELLTWLQDPHWPVAKDVAELLFPFTNDITQELLEILRTDDDQWKWNILRYFGYYSIDPVLHKEIKRIAEQPTVGEKANEVDVIAKSIIEEREET